jgi:hypothetical protein
MVMMMMMMRRRRRRRRRMIKTRAEVIMAIPIMMTVRVVVLTHILTYLLHGAASYLKS